jgi:hypothetical protein
MRVPRQRTLCSTFAILCLAAAPAGATEQWEFRIAPYLWLAGLNGDVGTLPGVPPSSVDASFADILYIDVAASGSTPGPLFSTADLDSRVLLGTITGFWRAWSDDSSSVDLVAGGRFWSVDTRLRLGAGVLPATTVSHDENWLDPVVGFRVRGALGGERIFQSFGLVLGGFGIGSDFMWDTDINLGYRWTDGFSTTIGYRYMDVDYSDGGFIYDVAQHGPTVALSWNF